ncbi:MAG: hydantoinase/oxoprolinase family protein [Deltaproteobacteria bacterium]|nr:hydantoinase/oxoprolinase family protein [Deltaproteobacteria bacterium]MBI3079567.1 hydantoinase/oxoprolinase family protein [Deltaproteobacteria bacterium]
MGDMINVGIDIGGTFTDLVLWDSESGKVHRGKLLTTPADPSLGAIAGMDELAAVLSLPLQGVQNVMHGTTLITNTLIERTGAKTGLITTQGFRDVLEIGREKRYDIYDIFLEMPRPLVPRRLRFEVSERLLPDGTVETPLDEDEARRVIARLRAQGVAAVAVCFLHAFRNPAHEQRMRALLQEQFPEAFLSLSTEVVPEIREYERTSTTVANAYVQPVMRQYLSRLRSGLGERGFGGSLFVMLSSGGIITGETAERYPVRIVESGPAAGAILASTYGHLLGHKRLLSFDMGGTTAKICLIEDGRPMVTTNFEVARVYRFKRGSGFPLKVPVTEMIEIGAGGGSIAHIDAMGLLQVGPQSAGASPGPACYSLGGDEPTVTDADLVLGYLDPGHFLGGKMALSLDRARQAVEHRIAAPLGMDLTRAAWGIHQVVDENMANAARIHAVERGQDPKAYVLMAFGGAGPVHAWWVAEKLGICKILIPAASGVASALGLLAAPFSFDLVRTYMARLPALDFGHLSRIFAEMGEEGAALLRGAGVPRDAITISRSCDMRYVDQGYEISVPIPDGRLTSDDREGIRAAFEREYERLFCRLNPGVEVEGLNWRVLASGPRPELDLTRAFVPIGRPGGALKGERPVYFPEGGYLATRVYDRYALHPGEHLRGPAIIEEDESTTVVAPGGSVAVDEYLNLVITP